MAPTPARPEPSPTRLRPSHARLRAGVAEARLALSSLLPLWFVACSIERLSQLHVLRGDFGAFGLDYRIYRGAALAWLNGVDPWSYHIDWANKTWSFAGMPTDFQLMAPFALLPETLAAILWVALSIVVVTVALRRLRLPLWFLVFPPIAEALVSWNPQLIVFGLLVIGAAAGDAIAVTFKVYAVIPLLAERRWRGVLAVAIALIASFALSPAAWLEYANRFGEISHRLVQESSGGFSASGWALPAIWSHGVPTWVPSWGPLVALVSVGLFLAILARDVRAAGWLAAPFLWPATEFHYAAFALPIARPLSLWLLAYPSRPAFIAGMMLLAVEVVTRAPALTPQPRPIGPRDWLRAAFADLGASGRRRVAWNRFDEEDETADAA